jgi:glutathione peroxidase
MSVCTDFQAESLQGENIALSRYQGQVLLIVNTASHCGFTPQYRGLQALQQQFQQQGFNVLAFPCNQFGAQEPGGAEEIQTFCSRRYAVDFPLFAKIEVNGPNAHPLFAHLTQQAKGCFGSRAIKWNFTKFLIRRDGSVYKRYGSLVPPQQIAKDIETLLQQSV